MFKEFVILQFEVAMTTPGGRAKFVESMDGIEKGVKQVQKLLSRNIYGQF